MARTTIAELLLLVAGAPVQQQQRSFGTQQGSAWQEHVYDGSNRQQTCTSWRAGNTVYTNCTTK